MYKISPHYIINDFKLPLDLDSKIKIFIDRTMGWQLDIAEKCINGEKDSNGKIIRQPLPGSGFAILLMVLSFFEMLAKYQDGYVERNEGKSKYYFKKGLLTVFPNISQIPEDCANDLLDVFYDVRCGLYHSANTNARIFLTGETCDPLGYNEQNKLVILNPHLFVPSIRKYFEIYVSQLKDPLNTQLRQKFNNRFNFDN